MKFNDLLTEGWYTEPVDHEKEYELQKKKEDDLLKKQGYRIDKEKGRQKSYHPLNIYDTYKVDKTGDIERPSSFNFSKLIKTKNNKIANVNEFFVCYFGDSRGYSYEYSAISTSEEELYETMRNWDMQEGILLKYNKAKKSVKGFTVYPFEDGK